jgi:hypothetical protein
VRREGYEWVLGIEHAACESALFRLMEVASKDEAFRS